MKYKVLLAGKSDSVINDFFTHMSSEFECMTTSCRYEDIWNHMKYFKPELFVYCPNGVINSDMDSIIFLVRRQEENRIPVALIASEEDCREFSQYAVNVADLIVRKPASVSVIVRKITDFMNENAKAVKTAPAPQAQTGIVQPSISEITQALLDETMPARKHILVVDDDALMLKMIKEHLRDTYDVATATSGKTALKFLEKRTTDLILLDYEMPQENGPEVLEKLHANRATKDIPVVFLTGITQRDKITQALVQKPQGYLLKPISRDKLLETINKLIG